MNNYTIENKLVLAFGLSLAAMVTACGSQGGVWPAEEPVVSSAENAAIFWTDSTSEWWLNQVVSLLSSPGLQGRGVGTDGLRKAEQTLASQFLLLGLRPLEMAKPSELNPYSFPVELQTGVVMDEGKTFLVANGAALLPGEGFVPAALSASVAFDGELLAVGFGTEIPEHDFDDFQGLDVEGKIVLVKRGIPDLELTYEQKAKYSHQKYKIFVAKQRGAVGVVFWDADESHDDSLPKLSVSGSVDSVSIPVLFMTRSTAQGFADQSGVVLNGQIQLERQVFTTHNIAAQFGLGCGNVPPIVLGAHLDHLGFGLENSLEPEGDKNVLHPGADDNASGIGGLLETTRLLRRALFLDPVQSFDTCAIVVGFTGEELGVVGSNDFVQVLNDNDIQPKAMLNLDMIGRLEDRPLRLISANSAHEWPQLIQSSCESEDLTCSVDEIGLGASDHVRFIADRVPAVQLHSGLHDDYHRKSDTADKIDYAGIIRISRLAADVFLRVADLQQPLTFDPDSLVNTSTGDIPGNRPYLGTIPDFSGGGDPTIAGILLSGATPGGPAEKAGVQAGDYLMAIDDKALETVQEFFYVLMSLTPGDTVMLKIYRDGEIIVLPALIEARLD